MAYLHPGAFYCKLNLYYTYQWKKFKYKNNFKYYMLYNNLFMLSIEEEIWKSKRNFGISLEYYLS